MKKLTGLLVSAMLLCCLALPAGAETTEETPPHEHTYSNAESVDGESHRQVCTVCQQERISPHTWDQGKDEPAAGCLTGGKKVFTCTQCGATKTQELSPLGHNWTSDENQHSCKNCGLQENHHWTESAITKQPTCKEEGVAQSQCTICGKQRMVVLEKSKNHTYDNDCDRDCNVCGAIRNVNHSYATTWSKDKEGHWHECSKCGDKGNYAKHTPGPEATEERDQVCKICNYVITPKKQHVHTYGTEWAHDEVGHWHVCKGCKNEKDYASHVFRNACDAKCSVCGFTRANSHTYGDKWESNKTEHWKVCTVCGEKSTPEKHVPGPEATDQNPQTCKVCNYELKPILEHTHDFGTQWFDSEAGHYQKCACGAQSVPEPHTWDAGKAGKGKTMVYTCIKCGAEKTEQKAASGPSWVVILLIFVALACVGGIAALVIILKRGNFFQEEEEEVDEPEDGEAEALDSLEDFLKLDDPDELKKLENLIGQETEDPFKEE